MKVKARPLAAQALGLDSLGAVAVLGQWGRSQSSISDSMSKPREVELNKTSLLLPRSSMLTKDKSAATHT